VERWQQERERYAQSLRARAEQTGGSLENAEWERYVRQTARMISTAEQLRAALPAQYALANGLRLRHQREEIYLEHLVVGPTGIYLIEFMEGNDEEWVRDQERAIAFFRTILGSHASLFQCFVIPRTTDPGRLPAGSLLVESLEAAFMVIQDERGGLTLSPAVAQEVWHIIQASAVTTPVQPPKVPFRRRMGRPQWTLLLTSFVMANTVFYYMDDLSVLSWVTGMILLVIPTAVVLGLILLLPWERARKIATYSLLVVTFLFFVILLAGASTQTTP